MRENLEKSRKEQKYEREELTIPLFATVEEKRREWQWRIREERRKMVPIPFLKIIQMSTLPYLLVHILSTLFNSCFSIFPLVIPFSSHLLLPSPIYSPLSWLLWDVGGIEHRTPILSLPLAFLLLWLRLKRERTIAVSTSYLVKASWLTLSGTENGVFENKIKNVKKKIQLCETLELVHSFFVVFIFFTYRFNV